ncbi:unnamed protein product [Camellia sinensis]
MLRLRHLFIHCPLIWRIWVELLEWWNVCWVTPESFSNLSHWGFGFKFRKLEKKMWRPWFGQFGRLVMTSSLMEFKSNGNHWFKIALWVKYKCKDVVFAVNDLVFNLAAVRGFRV